MPDQTRPVVSYHHIPPGPRRPEVPQIFTDRNDHRESPAERAAKVVAPQFVLKYAHEGDWADVSLRGVLLAKVYDACVLIGGLAFIFGFTCALVALIKLRSGGAWEALALGVGLMLVAAVLFMLSNRVGRIRAR